MVTPTDKLRFVLTCRFVKPEMVPEDMRSLGDFSLDPANAYDGDVKLYDDHMEKLEEKRKKEREEREKRMLAKKTASVVATSA